MALGAAALAAKQLLRPSSTGIPGIDLSSDTGRLAIARCYSAIPFSGNNRFSMGSVSTALVSFALIPSMGVWLTTPNVYLQLFASTGVLGFLGLVLSFGARVGLAFSGLWHGFLSSSSRAAGADLHLDSGFP